MTAQDWLNMLGQWLDSSDWIALLLGIYGAILSTVLAVRETRRDHRKVKVTCSLGILTGFRFEPIEAIMITVVNVGHRPVEITSAGFNLTDKRIMVVMDDIAPNHQQPLPKMIADGESVTVHKYKDSISGGLEEHWRRAGNSDLKITGAYVRDSTGRTYRAKAPRLLKDWGLAK